ncbi:hypothetical protein CDAR_118261 [Caerostris darwini]|uniref:Uncharacterized protein n=1 Tax=Caerostris darwini TaxID=1538125 RepID=A0AAV4NVN6_9ARAC|nr:hypothetical protein CDAR_118261 [Caerostris darwini]
MDPPRRSRLFMVTNDTILYALQNANDAEIPASTETETRRTFQESSSHFICNRGFPVTNLKRRSGRSSCNHFNDAAFAFKRKNTFGGKINK